MTTQPMIPGVAPAEVAKPRPGSRADRMLIPLAKDALRKLAEDVGVCVRPLAMRRTDTHTGATEVVDIPCGARLASKCKPCAERNRRDRIDQIREGWHLADEPMPPAERPSDDVRALLSTRAHLEFDRQEAMVMPMPSAKRAAEVEAIDEAIGEIETELSKCRLRGKVVACRDGKKPITVEALKEAGLIRRAKDGVRLLGHGELKAKLAFEVTGASGPAIKAIEAAGGTVTLKSITGREAPAADAIKAKKRAEKRAAAQAPAKGKAKAAKAEGEQQAEGEAKAAKPAKAKAEAAPEAAAKAPKKAKADEAEDKKPKAKPQAKDKP